MPAWQCEKGLEMEGDGQCDGDWMGRTQDTHTNCAQKNHIGLVSETVTLKVGKFDVRV